MPNNGNYSPYDLERVKKAIDYIHSHYAENISPKDLAKKLIIDEKKLQFLMQVLTGYTIHDYQINIRIEKAKLDLADFGKQVKWIARKHGFVTPPHFTKKFKQWVNLSPREYRRLLIQAAEPLDNT